jgi:hypothetical protein
MGIVENGSNHGAWSAQRRSAQGKTGRRLCLKVIQPHQAGFSVSPSSIIEDLVSQGFRRLDALALIPNLEPSLRDFFTLITATGPRLLDTIS